MDPQQEFHLVLEWTLLFCWPCYQKSCGIFWFSIFHAHLCWWEVEIFTFHGLFSSMTSTNMTANPSGRTLNMSFTWNWSHPCSVNALGLQLLYKSIFDLRVRCSVFSFWILLRILQGHQPHHMTANPSGRTLNKSFTWFWIGLCCSAGPITARAMWFFTSQFSVRFSDGVEDQL